AALLVELAPRPRELAPRRPDDQAAQGRLDRRLAHGLPAPSGHAPKPPPLARSPIPPPPSNIPGAGPDRQPTRSGPGTDCFVEPGALGPRVPCPTSSWACAGRRAPAHAHEDVGHGTHRHPPRLTHIDGPIDT